MRTFACSLCSSIFLIGYIGLSILGCTNSTSEKSPELEEVVIGSILPLTGDAAVYGQSCKKGIEIAVDEFNTTNSNMKYRVIYGDSKADPKTAISEMNKMINVDEVDFIVGDMFSSTAKAMAPIANSNKLLMISPTASSKDIPLTGIYSLSIFPSEDYEGKVVAEYAAGQGYRDVGIIFEKVPAAETMSKSFKSTFESIEGNVSFVESFPSGMKDFKNFIAKNRNSGIEALFIVTYAQAAKLIIKQIRELSWDVQIISQSALYDPEFIEDLDPYGNGMILTGSYFNDQQEDSEVQGFIQRFSQEFDENPDQMAAQGYDAVKVGARIINSVNKNNGDITKVVEDLKHKGITGEISFNENHSVIKPLSIFKVINNKFVLVKQ